MGVFFLFLGEKLRWKGVYLARFVEIRKGVAR